MVSNLEIIIRLILASILGALLGLERESSNRPAGFRTHVLVTLGSALIMLVSKDGFIFDGVRTGDPARLAAQVISGIGFLGAGTIMKTGDSIKGLTTAASLWVSAGLGLAIGAGYYLGGIVAGFIALLTLLNLGHFQERLNKSKYKTIEIRALNSPGIIGRIGIALGKHQISIKDIKIYSDDEKNEESEILEIRFTLKIPNYLDLPSLYNEIYNLEGVEALEYEGKIIFNSNKKINML